MDGTLESHLTAPLWTRAKKYSATLPITLMIQQELTADITEYEVFETQAGRNAMFWAPWPVDVVDIANLQFAEPKASNCSRTRAELYRVQAYAGNAPHVCLLQRTTSCDRTRFNL